MGLTPTPIAGSVLPILSQTTFATISFWESAATFLWGKIRAFGPRSNSTINSRGSIRLFGRRDYATP